MVAMGTGQVRVGRDSEDFGARQQARRADLLEAGVALLGDPDRPGVTVRAVCRRTRLTERYFYESFPDRDRFVVEVYQHVGARAHEALVAAIEGSNDRPRQLARAAVEAFVQLLVDTPAAGRVLLLAPLSEPALSGQGLSLVPAFVTLVDEQLSAVADAAEKHMTALGVVGGLTNLFIAYLEGALIVSRQQLVEHCVSLLIHANSNRAPRHT